MEIQFSIPVQGKPGEGKPAGQTSNASSSRPPASSRSAGAASSRGGVHRFALDSRTRHTRRSSTRARTGCSTCKKRHVKCDETKPACTNCIKWRGYCDGYTDSGPDSQHSRATPAGSTGKLIHTKKAPLLVTEPDVNTIRFENSDQRAYFDEWTALSITFLSGGLGHTRLWTATMPQLTLEEKSLRFAAMAVGALRRAYVHEGRNIGTALTTGNKHYLNAVIYYCEALRFQSKAQPTREGLRTALLSSLLFICFETQRANMPAALKHITHGFSMLNELANCTDKAPDLVSIAPAPPSLVQEILDCYKPLELQSRSFMGSYKKFFFPSGPRQPGQAPLGPTGPLNPSQSPSTGDQPKPTLIHAPEAATSSSPPQERTLSPPSQPGTPWQPQTEGSQPPGSTGLPSPQSQDSPISRTEQQSPPQGGPPMPPGGAPRRPPGILPFTKHSPYFRPKESKITSLDDMPRAFQSYDEAQGYWTLLQRQMVQYIPMLTMTTAQLALTKVNDDIELERRLSSVKQNPRISKFVAESRFWLQRWIEAFDPYFVAVARRNNQDPAAYLQAANLRIEYLILYIYTAVPRYSGLITARSLTPQYREIIILAETLLQARPNCGFAMDSGWTWPLFVASFGCRDRAVRDDAIRVLGQYPIRNALRDSRVFRAVALRNREAEESILAWDDGEQAQWLRLRRREVVFEDFGASVIFRSPQRDAMTGQWVLIEEAANIAVRDDGTLDWQQQPISEASSILSGVC